MTRFCYEYPRPAFSVDAVVVAGPASARKVLLVKRCADPYKDWWALPGGFVDEGERPSDAVRRELAEETGVVWEGPMTPIGTFGDPGRDPRGWTVSGAFLIDIGLETPVVVASDDACDAQWWFIDECPRLAFDHDDMLDAALALLSRA